MVALTLHISSQARYRLAMFSTSQRGNGSTADARMTDRAGRAVAHAVSTGLILPATPGAAETAAETRSTP